LAISIRSSAEPVGGSRSIAFRVLLGTAIVALAVGAYFLSRSSVFHARGVQVTGASHLSRAEVLGASGVSRATNVLWLDEGAAERALESKPWIADAEVHVAFPWTVEIAVVERVPVAVASDGTIESLVAADGTVLGPPGRERWLPRIELPPRLALDGRSESPRGAAVAIGAMDPELRAEVASVSVFAGGSLEIRLRSGIAVRYGAPSEPERKAEIISRILGWARTEGESLAAVNVVAPAAPAVRLSA
jgi:cell division protein FtsQ